MTLRFTRFGTLCGALATLFLLVAAPAQATHPRPAGASPMRMPLVPAYAACAAANRTHGPPLAFASCNPPAQTSSQAAVGTPDALAVVRTRPATSASSTSRAQATALATATTCRSTSRSLTFAACRRVHAVVCQCIRAR